MLGGGGAPVPAPSSQPGYGPRPAPGPSTPQGAPEAQKADAPGAMMKAVLGDTEDVWKALFQAMGQRGGYPPTPLVLYQGGTRTACGLGQAAMGPFYCPADRKIYLDTAFFNELSQRFRAPGDFAQAYVVAHEVGHHVQNVLGTMEQFDRQVSRLDARSRNQMQIRLELQADCYAGVWGFFAQKRGLLEPGDLEEGLRAASAVGDDMIMKRTQGYVVPDAMTHGTAEQRQRWFRKGLATGDPRQCDTFSAPSP
jgi:predicted metalloprotease